MGVSDALGKQTLRRARSLGTLSRTDEPAKRARLANMARLSIAHTEALSVHGCGPENILEGWARKGGTRCSQTTLKGSALFGYER
jgi:hypothetical protein